MGADCSTVQRCTGSETAVIKPMEVASNAVSYPKAKRSKSKEAQGDASQNDSKEAAPIDKVEKRKEKADKKVDKIRVEKNWKRLRKAALEAAGEINHFSVFVKRSFGPLDKSFDAIAGKTRAHVDLNAFVTQLEKHGFTGNAERVFYGLCDDKAWDTGAIITRAAFEKRLASIGSHFASVVRQACVRNQDKIKRKVTQQLKAKNRDQELIDDFRNFVEPRFPTPGKAFDAIAGDDGCIDEEEFVEWLGSMDYPGDAANVFHNFCDADGYIMRVAFSEILVRDSTESETVLPSKGKGLQRMGTVAWNAGKGSSSVEQDATTAANPQEPMDTVDQKEKETTRRSKSITSGGSGSEEAPTKEKSSKRRSTSRSASKDKVAEQGASGDIEAKEENTAAKTKKPSRSSSKDKSLDAVDGKETGAVSAKSKKPRRSSSKDKSLETGSPDRNDGVEDAPASKTKKPSRSASKDKVGEHGGLVDKEAKEEGKPEAKNRRRLSRTSSKDSPADEEMGEARAASKDAKKDSTNEKQVNRKVSRSKNFAEVKRRNSI